MIYSLYRVSAVFCCLIVSVCAGWTSQHLHCPCKNIYKVVVWGSGPWNNVHNLSRMATMATSPQRPTTSKTCTSQTTNENKLSTTASWSTIDRQRGIYKTRPFFSKDHEILFVTRVVDLCVSLMSVFFYTFWLCSMHMLPWAFLKDKNVAPPKKRWCYIISLMTPLPPHNAHFSLSPLSKVVFVDSWGSTVSWSLRISQSDSV